MIEDEQKKEIKKKLSLYLTKKEINTRRKKQTNYQNFLPE